MAMQGIFVRPVTTKRPIRPKSGVNGAHATGRISCAGQTDIDCGGSMREFALFAPDVVIACNWRGRGRGLIVYYAMRCCILNILSSTYLPWVYSVLHLHAVRSAA
ncbi:hypothetical protein BDV59DRAFT_45165 [Aspergillus ambiguus]|uniref:uncharacterized protein n=1 Tax=Aspergillus ambiguus TaxID=176160 RepID=UPI003CCC932B